MRIYGSSRTFCPDSEHHERHAILRISVWSNKVIEQSGLSDGKGSLGEEEPCVASSESAENSKQADEL